MLCPLMVNKHLHVPVIEKMKAGGVHRVGGVWWKIKLGMKRGQTTQQLVCTFLRVLSLILKGINHLKALRIFFVLHISSNSYNPVR